MKIPKSAISTGNWVGDSAEMFEAYPNRRRECATCGAVFYVSLKKSLKKVSLCRTQCQPKGYWNKGRALSLEQRQWLSDWRKGDKSPFWKGGITSINQLIRNGTQIRIWRERVFARDNWTCLDCGARGVYLQADHIKPFAYFPKLRFDITNGRTLCRGCHKKTPTFGYGARKLYECNS